MEMTKYAPGTPCWVDLGADQPKAEAFYGALFGWEATEPGPVEETGGYQMLTYKGKNVAGLGPQQGPGHPYWTTYISVADADDTTARVQKAGGTVFVEPMDVMDAGRMAVFADPTGAAFAIWEPNLHIGAQLANEPSSLVWNELQTRDVEASKAFYTEVFGWGVGGSPEYVEWQVDGRVVGAMMPMPDMVPDMVPNFWLAYFGVDDCDAAVAKVGELGGSTLVPPMDIDHVGRFAVVTDDQGATFAVIKLAPERL